MSTIYLCGRIKGVDCASGQQWVYEFVTLDKSVAEANVKKYDGSWDTAGFFKEMQCTEIANIVAYRDKLERENTALRADKERLDVLSEETRDMYCFLRHSDYAAGIRIYAYFTNVSGRNFPNHMTLREATDAIIADRHAARKEQP